MSDQVLSIIITASGTLIGCFLGHVISNYIWDKFYK